jgi:hypothetical protein
MQMLLVVCTSPNWFLPVNDCNICMITYDCNICMTGAESLSQPMPVFKIAKMTQPSAIRPSGHSALLMTIVVAVKKSGILNEYYLLLFTTTIGGSSLYGQGNGGLWAVNVKFWLGVGVVTPPKVTLQMVERREMRMNNIMMSWGASISALIGPLLPALCSDWLSDATGC